MFLGEEHFFYRKIKKEHVKKFFSAKKFFHMTKKIRPICHSKRLNALYPTVSRSSFYIEYELNYKSIYSYDFVTLTRYNARQTRFRAKIFADLASARREESIGI